MLVPFPSWLHFDPRIAETHRQWHGSGGARAIRVSIRDSLWMQLRRTRITRLHGLAARNRHSLSLIVVVLTHVTERFGPRNGVHPALDG